MSPTTFPSAFPTMPKWKLFVARPAFPNSSAGFFSARPGPFPQNAYNARSPIHSASAGTSPGPIGRSVSRPVSIVGFRWM